MEEWKSAEDIMDKAEELIEKLIDDGFSPEEALMVATMMSKYASKAMDDMEEDD